MRQVIVIPARYQSSRLPGKPLIDLLGASMLQRTHARCRRAFPAQDIYVATDDRRIYDHCMARDMQVVMTSPDCLTGTDRVAELARTVEADTYINVQGDEPLMNPADIRAVAAAAMAHPDSVVNGVTEIDDEDLYRSPTIPKVVMRQDGRLLYMSRGSIPANKAGGFVKAWRQVCVYAFPRPLLEVFASAGRKAPLEEVEDIEILRFLELGYEVLMVPLSRDSIAVDVPGDVEKVLRIIRAQETGA